MPQMPEFTKVNSLETPTAVYSVGKIIKFWDIGERAWLKGKITAITQCEGYFVSATVSHQSFKKKREIQINREDWLDTKTE
ncbi:MULTISPECIES: hypothetical protein [Nostocaceae]|uniref:hypothetical protein n=1 Tax=Nostocaceae TaxID=1162 RepID=UPI00000CEE8D|nr:MULTISPECIES: hypothetical protein [Nostocaceae]RUR76141.1 hypothetical protein DSM107007_47280 [Nostoc sp. PCC 7120 = FACHB-418]BAB78131.1 asr7047 [Nostoc sp. PCC 7120 = FACHB-418]